jgi:hypothetical protein
MTKAQRGMMLFEELHNRYGAHVTRRVQQELTSSEFAQISIDQLPTWLETRAETAHQAYEQRLGNPFGDEAVAKKAKAAPSDSVDSLYRRWREAEELAYIIAVAEDVTSHAQAMAGK